MENRKLKKIELSEETKIIGRKKNQKEWGKKEVKTIIHKTFLYVHTVRSKKICRLIIRL